MRIAGGPGEGEVGGVGLCVGGGGAGGASMTEAGGGEPDATDHHAPEKLLLLTGPKTKDRTTYRLEDGTEVRVAETHNVEQQTGFIVWDAAWCLARHLEKRAAHFADLVGTGTVAELGSGTGLSGLTAAHSARGGALHRRRGRLRAVELRRRPRRPRRRRLLAP